MDEELISATQAEQLAETRTPQGVFATVYWDSKPTAPDPGTPLLILDRISDPGNVGTIFRTADWFGIPSVRVSADSVDIVNPKVVRGAMGAHFHLPDLYQGDLSALGQWLRDEDIPIIGGVLGGETMSTFSTKRQPSPDRWALVLGNEAHGLSKQWLDIIDYPLAIPGGGQAESLNVTVAAGIMLHYLLGTDEPSETKRLPYDSDSAK